MTICCNVSNTTPTIIKTDVLQNIAKASLTPTMCAIAGNIATIAKDRDPVNVIRDTKDQCIQQFSI